MCDVPAFPARSRADREHACKASVLNGPKGPSDQAESRINPGQIKLEVSRCTVFSRAIVSGFLMSLCCSGSSIIPGSCRRQPANVVSGFERRAPTQRPQSSSQQVDLGKEAQEAVQETRRNDLGLTNSLLNFGPVATGFPLPLWYSAGQDTGQATGSSELTARERFLQRLMVSHTVLKVGGQVHHSYRAISPCRRLSLQLQQSLDNHTRCLAHFAGGGTWAGTGEHSYWPPCGAINCCVCSSRMAAGTTFSAFSRLVVSF